MGLDPEAGSFPAPSRLPERPDLPDPLVTLEGERVETPERWRERRAELLALFRHYVYGHDPGPIEVDVEWDRVGGVLGGSATLHEATIRLVDLPAAAPALTLALFLPADADAPAPDAPAATDAADATATQDATGAGNATDTPDHTRAVPTVLGLNGFGNAATVAEEAVAITDSVDADDADVRGALADFWCVDAIVERGYGFATVHCDEIEPDRNELAGGVREHVDPADLPGPPGTEWGTIAAWAWGLSRCVDALEAADGVREDGIAVFGHSRRGKAALLAGATDERFALVVPHQSGTGGCTLARDNDQETVTDITAGFPHWFDDVFAAFSGQAARLPVDQHCLIALVAPRPLLDTEGARDHWANPDRALDAVRAAAPVWELHDVEGTVGDGLVTEGRFSETPLTAENAGNLCQFRRSSLPYLESAHTLDRGYWERILEFADLHLR